MSQVSPRKRRLSAAEILAKKHASDRIVSLTAYDYTTAKLLDETQRVDFLLVGDSLAMVVLGHEDTLQITVDEMIHHVKAVSKGTQRAMVVADMPFMSVHVDETSAIQNVGRMIQEGRADAVKIEGASALTLQVIRRVVEMGIPVMGHLGFTPQSIHTMGGFKVQGKTEDAANRLIEDAKALEAAGAFAVVLEMVPREVASLVSRVISVPTIGIGAGAGCDGQILVIDDMLGKFPDFRPRFVRTYANLQESIQQAVSAYATDVLSGEFPHPETESFATPPDLLAMLPALESRWLNPCDPHTPDRPYAHR